MVGGGGWGMGKWYNARLPDNVQYPYSPTNTTMKNGEGGGNTIHTSYSYFIFLYGKGELVSGPLKSSGSGQIGWTPLCPALEKRDRIQDKIFKKNLQVVWHRFLCFTD